MFSSQNVIFVIFIILIFVDETNQKVTIELSETKIIIPVKSTEIVYLTLIGSPGGKVIRTKVTQNELIYLTPEYIQVPGYRNSFNKVTIPISITALDVGLTDIFFIVSDQSEAIYARVEVARSIELITLASFVGWLYFIIWSVSFYPQVWLNYKRQSVVGLNFDFLALELCGFLMYLLYNSFLYFDVSIESEYMLRHPTAVNPVQLNDIIYSVHAIFLLIATIYQCSIYERGGQRVSITGWCVLSIYIITLMVSLGLAEGNVIHYLDFLGICNYIKLSTTVLKNIPQAWLNYKRRSTKGWSIYNVICDTIGGILSLMQMLIIGYNYGDFGAIFGNFAKVGLALLTIAFDVFFMVQHYILYKKPSNPATQEPVIG